MLPSTCVLPSQQERILRKQREKVELYAESMKSEFRRVLERGDATAPLNSVVAGPELLAMCGYVTVSNFINSHI